MTKIKKNVLLEKIEIIDEILVELFFIILFEINIQKLLPSEFLSNLNGKIILNLKKNLSNLKKKTEKSKIIINEKKNELDQLIKSFTTQESEILIMKNINENDEKTILEFENKYNILSSESKQLYKLIRNYKAVLDIFKKSERTEKNLKENKKNLIDFRKKMFNFPEKNYGNHSHNRLNSLAEEFKELNLNPDEVFNKDSKFCEFEISEQGEEKPKLNKKNKQKTNSYLVDKFLVGCLIQLSDKI